MPKLRAPGKTGPWRLVNRVQLAELLGVHQDTISRYVREGMPVIEAGGQGRESVYDAVHCLAWWREGQGRNAKEAAQTRAYTANARLNELKLARQRGELLPREEVVRQGQGFVKGWVAKLRSLPRRAVQTGVIAATAEAGLVALCLEILTEISRWTTLADAEREEDEAA